MSDTATATPPVTPATPPVAKLAGKYDDAEALGKGYRELRKTMGLDVPAEDKPLFGGDTGALEGAYKDLETLHGKLKAAPKAEPKPGELAIKPVETKPPTNPNQVVGSVFGITDPAAAEARAYELGEKWTKAGALDADDYAKFEAKGFPRAMVDSYMQGQQALAAQAAGQRTAALAEGVKVAGGEEQHNNLRAWAAHNVPPAELDRLGKLVEADPAFYPTMMEIIANRHRQAVAGGKAQPLITGSAPGGVGGPATSNAEFLKLLQAAREGDTAALARVNATTPEQVAKWSP